MISTTGTETWLKMCIPIFAEKVWAWELYVVYFKSYVQISGRFHQDDEYHQGIGCSPLLEGVAGFNFGNLLCFFNASCLLGEYFHVQFKQASNPRWQRSIMQFLFVGL